MTLYQARAHLLLLSAFERLRENVRSGNEFDTEGEVVGGEVAPPYDYSRTEYQGKKLHEDHVTAEMKEREEIAGEP